jgi:hypothetical protein
MSASAALRKTIGQWGNLLPTGMDGEARLGESVEAWFGWKWLGEAVMFWRVKVGCGVEGCGVAVEVMQGMGRQGGSVMVWCGEIRRGMAVEVC